MARVKFQEWACQTQVGTYENGNTALLLWDEEGPVATATINLGESLPADKAYVKDYSENAGMLQALLDAGIVQGILGVARVNGLLIPLCKLDLAKLGMQ